MLSECGLKQGELTLFVGGPPCQPFSRARAWVGPPPGRQDERARTLAAFFRLAAAAAPEVLLLENVPGLGSSSGQYLRRKINELGRRVGARYSAAFLDLDAADFGIPQHRRRLFMVCVRGDSQFRNFPATHGDPNENPLLDRYRTAWDAIGHLDNEKWPQELECSGRWAGLLPSIPEGANYLHHTPKGKGMPLFGYRTRFWSFLLKLAKNQPSWTLSATPGPATGPFHWRNRRLSTAEMAALQTIPVVGDLDIPLAEARRLIGNAVPSALAEKNRIGDTTPDPRRFYRTAGGIAGPRLAFRCAGGHRSGSGPGSVSPVS